MSPRFCQIVFAVCVLLGLMPERARSQSAAPGDYAPPTQPVVAQPPAWLPPVSLPAVDGEVGADRAQSAIPLPRTVMQGQEAPILSAPMTPPVAVSAPYSQTAAAQPIVPVTYNQTPPNQAVQLGESAEAQTVPPVSPSIGPGSPEHFGLGELVSIAINFNPILRREQAEIEEAMGERIQSGLYPNPNMETNNPEVFAGQFAQVNFGFQQFIIVKGKMRLDKAAADQLVRQVTAEYRLERAKMVTEVRKQYYETLAAKHRVFLARHLVGIAERGVNGARQLEKAGEGTRTDVLLLDTEYQRERISLQNAETTYDGELKQLAAIVGVPEIVIRDVAGTLFDIPPRFNEQDVQTFLTRASTYIERARAEITRSQVQLRRAEVEPYPNIRMGPSYATSTVPSSAQFWLTVEFPIPVWDLNQGNIRKANATVDAKLAELEVARNELNRRSAELFAKHVAARERAERIRVEILPNAQEAQRLIQDAYVKGQFEVSRLLQAQRNLAEVADDYFDAAEESWVTAAELAGMLQLEQFP